MIDKVVGELWARRHGQRQTFTISSLIRKLVMERAAHECEFGNPVVGFEQCDSQALHIESALNDFGIDAKTWEVKP